MRSLDVIDSDKKLIIKAVLSTLQNSSPAVGNALQKTSRLSTSSALAAIMSKSIKSNDKTCGGGPGYATPLQAFANGPQEKLLYVVTVQPDLSQPNGDYLSTVDVDPESKTFCQIIHRTHTNFIGDELHHSGWNTCSSCFGQCTVKRDKLILPSLNSDAIYIVDVGEDARRPKIYKKISGDLVKAVDLTAPHTAHCLADGRCMISCMGDANGNAQGDFVLLSPQFDVVGRWTAPDSEKAKCGYDFWYQPHFDVMVASEWGAPKLFRRGFHPSDIGDGLQYGRRLNFYKWSTNSLTQTIDLGPDGVAPLEIRFLHNPREAQGYVGAALLSNIFRFYKPEPDDINGEFRAEKVIDIPAKRVRNWSGGEQLNGMMSDILISLDDRFLYCSNWLHGDVRQYDISGENRVSPKLTGQIFLGGVLANRPEVEVIEDTELTERPLPCFVKGRQLLGGPQMLQLSLDGRRLYVSSSLYSPWDRQFYPEMVKAGGTIVQIDCDLGPQGGMQLNQKFLVDFGGEPFGPTLPHEMRYPGGDCTSDIWLADES